MQDSLSPWFHLFHFIGLALLFSLPITALVIRTDMQGENMRVVARLAGFLGRMDRVALAGAIIQLLSGIGLMWVDGITLGDAFSAHQPWLGIKLVLFALLLLNGYFLAGPAIRNRVSLIQGFENLMRNQLSGDQQKDLQSSYIRMQVTGIPMMVLMLAILICAVFTPFTANPP